MSREFRFDFGKQDLYILTRDIWIDRFSIIGIGIYFLINLDILLPSAITSMMAGEYLTISLILVLLQAIAIFLYLNSLRKKAQALDLQSQGYLCTFDQDHMTYGTHVKKETYTYSELKDFKEKKSYFLFTGPDGSYLYVPKRVIQDDQTSTFIRSIQKYIPRRYKRKWKGFVFGMVMLASLFLLLVILLRTVVNP